MTSSVKNLQSLYIHIPFCVSKCHYCDFNSIGLGAASVPEKTYCEALSRELGFWREILHHELKGSMGTIFFGGGTPSLFSAEGIEDILTQARKVLPFSPAAEITLEMNPKTAHREKMLGFLKAGVNRLSIGVQTLKPSILKQLSRAHDAADALHALEWAYEVNFPRINIDLMYGLPEQTREDLKATFAELRVFPLKHLSAYELIVEEGTPFYDRYFQGRLPLPELPDVLAMRDAIQEFASNKGMEAYEVSNYASPGHESRHNGAYWNYDSFVGLGAGAVSFLRDSEIHPEFSRRLAPSPGEEIYAWRITNPRALADYQGRESFAEGADFEAIDFKTAMGEFMMMGLRRREGISFEAFEGKFSRPFPDCYREIIARAARRGWMVVDARGGHFTEAGLLLSNEVLQEFLPAD